MVTDGAVTGVKAAGTDGTEYVLTANKGVILASGGFAANNEMCMKYKPSLLPTLKSTNSAAITAAGIVFALVSPVFFGLRPAASPILSILQYAFWRWLPAGLWGSWHCLWRR